MKMRFHNKVFISFFIILTIVGFFWIRGSEYDKICGEYSSIDISKCGVNLNQCELVDGRYTVKGVDPYIMFDFTQIDKSVYGVKFNLKQEIDLKNVQVYYADETGFSEFKSIRYAQKKSDVIEFTIGQSIKYFRIDVDEDMSLDDFSIAYDFSTDRVGGGILYLFGMIIASMISGVLAMSEKIGVAIDSLLNTSKKYIKCTIRHKYRVIVFGVCILLEAIASLGIEKIYEIYYDMPYFNKFHMLFIFIILFVCTFFAFFRKWVRKYAHITVLVVIMAIGTLNIVSVPPAAGVSWDDEIHYTKTAFLSWGAHGEYTIVDKTVLVNYTSVILEKKGYSREQREDWIGRINALAEEGNVFTYADMKLNGVYVSYFPAALGLNIGRTLGLSYEHTFLLGKFMNLLCYSVIISISVSLLKRRGQIIVAFLSMIPTSIFMASSYAYDWFVIAFVILGYSLIYKKLQNKEKISTLYFVVVLLVMFIGILPKAIYFMLLVPMFFIKKENLEKPGLSKTLVIMTMFLLVMTFILPMLISSGAGGDIRGGSDVSVRGQIAYILNNPIKYTKTLIKFLIGYLSLDASQSYLTFFSYLGYAEYFTIIIVIISAAIMIDNNKNVIGKENNFNKYATVLSIVSSIVLVATALYIDFTPVGAETINGCQYRYILPVLFPLFITFGEIGIDASEKTKDRFFILGTVLMSMIFLLGIDKLCISLY